MTSVESRLAMAKGLLPDGVALGPGPADHVARIYATEGPGYPRTGIGYINAADDHLYLDIRNAPSEHQTRLLAVAARYGGRATTLL
ncbi:MAG: hypothetical protein HY519_04300 [Candidatus Aenigmarchaeota archaeon]|nr:hypothetical protein [Candidatus Aenigmarchaeota archaeon]